MEAACDVCMINQGKQLKIWTTAIVAILFWHHYCCIYSIQVTCLTASPKSTFRSALCLIGGGDMERVGALVGI